MVGIGIEDEGFDGTEEIRGLCEDTVRAELRDFYTWLSVRMTGESGMGMHEVEQRWSGKIFESALDETFEKSEYGDCKEALPLHILDTPITCKDILVHDSLRSYMYLI